MVWYRVEGLGIYPMVSALKPWDRLRAKRQVRQQVSGQDMYMYGIREGTKVPGLRQPRNDK